MSSKLKCMPSPTLQVVSALPRSRWSLPGPPVPAVELAQRPLHSSPHQGRCLLIPPKPAGPGARLWNVGPGPQPVAFPVFPWRPSLSHCPSKFGGCDLVHVGGTEEGLSQSSVTDREGPKPAVPGRTRERERWGKGALRTPRP